jgi:ribonuclease HII
VAQVRQLVAGARPEPGDELWDALASDPRRGVADILRQIARSEARARAERERLSALRRDEAELWAAGARLVAGVDEAGRGPLAGPVVAAAVILPEEVDLPGLDDSKKVAPARREELFARIAASAVAVGVGRASEKVIDGTNILSATLGAMRDAVLALSVRPDHVIVDGNDLPRGLDLPATAIPRGDGRSAAIAAASIVAKVTRDRLLTDLDAKYPGYGFARHKGYGTSEHVAALARLGPCEIHRRSFGLVMEASGGFSEAFVRFRGRLLGAESRESVERIGAEIAREKESIPPHELSRLRGVYARALTRVTLSISPRR